MQALDSYNFDVTLMVSESVNDILFAVSFTHAERAHQDQFSLSRTNFERFKLKELKSMIGQSYSHLFSFGPDGLVVSSNGIQILDDDSTLVNCGIAAWNNYEFKFLKERPVQEVGIVVTKLCRKCGATRLGSDPVCIVCSHRHEDTPSTSAVSILGHPSDQYTWGNTSKYCNKCYSKRLRPTQKVCTECGNRFNDFQANPLSTTTSSLNRLSVGSSGSNRLSSPNPNKQLTTSTSSLTLPTKAHHRLSLGSGKLTASDPTTPITKPLAQPTITTAKPTTNDSASPSTSTTQSAPTTPVVPSSSRLAVLTGPSRLLTASSPALTPQHAITHPSATATPTPTPDVKETSASAGDACAKCSEPKKSPTQKVCMECGERFPGAGPVVKRQPVPVERKISGSPQPLRARSSTGGSRQPALFTSSAPTTPQKLIQPQSIASFYCANCSAPKRTETQKVCTECGVKFGTPAPSPNAGSDASTNIASSTSVNGSQATPLDAASQGEIQAVLEEMKRKHEHDLKQKMLQMKRDGKSVDDIKAYVVKQKKLNAEELIQTLDAIKSILNDQKQAQLPSTPSTPSIVLSATSSPMSEATRSDSKRKLVGKWMSALDDQKKRDDSVKSNATEFTKSKSGLLSDKMGSAPPSPLQRRLSVNADSLKPIEPIKRAVEIIESPDWGTICRGRKGKQVWSIRNEYTLAPEPAKLGEENRLCQNDVVIVLQSIREFGPYHIFYWFGSKASKKKKGVAVEKLVPELDDIFGGLCAHHREIEGHESLLFLALFKKENGILILDIQGKSTQIQTNLDDFKTVLLHVKGRKNVGVTPVKVTFESLNSGDVFVLDTGLTVYCWNGAGSSRAEKATGVQTALKFRDSRGGRPTVVIVDEGKETVPFWDALGGKGRIKSADEVEDDEAYERSQEKAVKLYHVSDASGKLVITHIASPPLQQQFLNEDDCHILDVGNEIFVWIGKGCTEQERSSAMSTAEGFLRDSDRPDWVPITRFIQGSETPTFQSQFVHWSSYHREEIRSPTPQKRPEAEQFKSKQKRRRSNVHLDSLITRQSNDQQRVDASYTLDAEKFDTSGDYTLTIYRVQNFKRELLEKKEIGVFYSGDSYVIQFLPVSSSLASPIVYFWLGRHSSADEKGGAAFHAKELAGGKASHCRITQGKEPPHFVNLFRGKMVVRDGGVASGFNTIDEEDKLFDGEPELFHIKGTNERDTRAVQVGTTCASLNSADCFVLNCQKMKKQFVWYGKGSEEIERDYATRVAAFLVEISEIPESEWTLSAFEEETEPEEFFSLLGGKSDYMNAPELTQSVKEPRLFQCSDSSGGFNMEEIFNFNQEDLALDDVFILDVYTSVYVWVGPESNDEEKSQSFEIALEYVYACSNIDGRDPDTPVICTFAGFEPPMFTCWFHPWDAALSGKDNYTLLMEGLNMHKGVVEHNVEDVLQLMNDAKSDKITQTYSYKELRRNRGNTVPLPSPYINQRRLEYYLHDDEFLQIFKMSKDEWTNSTIPQWKKMQMKAKAMLM